MHAQLPDDVLRYSFFPQHGSARSMAIGGAMGSLGGDISSLYANPAGLGLYKTGEVVLTPAFMMNNNKMNFRGTASSAKKSTFDLGALGVVIGFGNKYSKWTSQAFSFGVNQTANYNNTISYAGTNNGSSHSEQFTEAISQSGLSIDQVLNNPRFAYGSAPALYTYLVDTFRTSSNNLELRGLPEFLLAKGIALDQRKDIQTSGGVYELAFGYAGNMDDKFYIGGSVGIPIVNYERHTFYRESDPSGDLNNNFSFFELDDNLSTTGVGVNFRLGAIYKPTEFVRLGLTVHTPTFYSLTDKQSSVLSANTEAYNGNKTAVASSSIFTGSPEGKTQYSASTPWKAVVSGSYVFREISDTRRQRAFITADIEYVGYSNSRFSSTGEDVPADEESFYKALKGVIKDYYQGAFNFRLGGELKFHTFMVRAGTAYYGNPYRDRDNLKANIVQASGGLGYRDHGIFIDLTYVHNFNKDVNFPYRLGDKSNTFAEHGGYKGNVVATIGFKF